MVTRHGHDGITWVDLETPTREEFADVMREFSIDPRVEEEMIAPTPYPLTVSFPDYAYTVLHFPSPMHRGESHDQEVDLIAGKRFIITSRYEAMSPLHNLHKIFEAEELLGTFPEEKRADVLLERFFGKFYAAIRDEIERTGSSLVRIERGIFSGEERAMVEIISRVGRDLLHYETSLDRQREVLGEFLATLESPRIFGDAFAERRKSILLAHESARHLAASHRAVVRELRETNDSLLEAKQNDIMKKLTVITFVVLPLTLIASLFQMNTRSTPIVGLPNDFWIVVAVMVLCSGFIALFVARRHWL